jgi:copper chaperone CopZ
MKLLLLIITFNLFLQQTITTQLEVSGNCNMCKKRIETAALRENGVKSVTWDKQTKQLVVIHKAKTDVESIKKAILLAGHDVDKQKADVKIYEKLPECCSYRNPEAKTH